MNKTYLRSIWRTIRGTMSRFLAIFAIVALGVGFLAGLLATTPDMRYSGDVYFDKTHLFDVRVAGTLALSEENVAAVQAVEGVGDTMPAYSADVLVDTPEGDTLVTRIHSIPLDQLEEKQPQGWLNRFEVREGRVPVNEDECVVEAASAYSGEPIQVGDTLTLAPDNDDLDSTFTRTQFKVVGIVESSYYFSIEREPASVGSGSIGLVMYVGEQNFALDAYTDLYLSVEGAQELNCLGSEYEDLVDEVCERIEAISGAQCQARYAQVKTDAERKLADAQAEYEDAKADAEQQLADAERQLEDGRAALEENRQKLEDAKAQIAQGEKELEQNKATLPDTLTQKQQELADGQAALIDAKAQLEASEATLQQKRQELEAAKAQLEAAKQMVPVLESAAAQAEAQLPGLKVQAEAAAKVRDEAKASYDSAVAGAGLDGLKTAWDTAAAEAQSKQDAYDAAQQAVADGMAAAGVATEDEWLANNETVAQPLIQARDNAKTALDNANEAAAAAQAAYETAEEAVADEKAAWETAEQQAQRAQNEYDAASAAVSALRTQLDDTEAQIAQAEPQITSGEAQLAAGEKKLAEARQQLTEAEKQIASGQTALSLAPALAQLQLQLAEDQLEGARQQAELGEQQLADAQAEFEEGEAEYQREKADAEQQLADAEQQLADARQAISELEVPEWYVLGRDTNVSYASYASNVEKVEAVAKVFPLFFFLVAALVALTTMTRMVEEERLLIGTMKALGYTKRAIMMKYVWYALAASVLGSAFGLAVGLRLFPAVIWNAYAMMYNLPKLYYLFNAQFAVFSSAAAILCTLGATLYACWSTLHECPAQLMLPRAPMAGKRIFLERIGPVWRRMRFTYKVTARNLFRYKKRFFMTVVGIAGCTALLVAGFGLHDSISDIVNRQFGEIFTYNLTITLDSEQAAQDEALQAVLQDGSKVQGVMAFHQEKSTNTYGDDSFATYLYVPQQAADLPGFVDLHTRRGGTPVALDAEGVVITEKMAERTGVGVGDTIQLENNNRRTGNFVVTGVVENYVENYVYMTSSLYKEQFGQEPEFTMLAVHTTGRSQQERDELSSELFGLDAVAGVSFTDDLKASFTNMMQKIDTIVVVLIVSAGLLAFVVLYNLTNINITERTKEIATIKVLGFYDREVSAYVYRESVALSVIGTLVGLVLGIALHTFVVYTVEVDAVMFGRTIKLLSYLAAALLTMLFSLLVDLVMRRKLKKVSMVESMKAPE